MRTPFPNARTFPTIVMLTDHILDLVQQKASLAFALNGVSYIKDRQILTYFNCQWDWEPNDKRRWEGIGVTYDSDLLQEVATKSIQESIRLYAYEPLPSCGPVGEWYESKVFPTTIPGLQLQAIKWCCSWTAFGGADVGGTNYVWLLNHPPVTLGS